MFVGDLSQLDSIGGSTRVRNFCLDPLVRKFVLEQHPRARSNDPLLLDFLTHIRENQPTRSELESFFGDRYLGMRLLPAVQHLLSITGFDAEPITWLTCTNRGAHKVNAIYLRLIGQHYGEDWDLRTLEQRPDAFPVSYTHLTLPTNREV